ncbi:glycosyltransferase family 4 protein [Microbispora sp. NEAU-D428]|uniref:glycosyltransferase family 4 protein n=1 Tax=Microbispora sitophila TaxID=2771537 RepID=UPI001866FC09|nr:glycosyltransferase family 4 protein [Microbispora sitophila]MBE3013300.1 glycosyltransferase family 4 protein [Microbispora sitophila]
MRILHIGYRLPPEPGGKELYIERLVREQVRRGHDVIVAHRRGAPLQGTTTLLLPPVRASRIVSLKSDEIAFAMECAKALARTRGLDVIHLHGDHREALALGPAARRLGIPLVLHVHGALTTRHRPIMPWAFRHIGGFIVSGTRPRSDLLGVGVPDRLIRMMPSGVELGHLARFRGSAPIERGLIVSVGSLVKVKNHELTIEAFHRVRAARPDSRLVIAGDGPERDRLRRLAGTGPGIEFLGQVPSDQVYALVSRADAFVHSSRRLRTIGEGIPTAPLEALALGTAVLVSSEASLDPAVPPAAYRVFRSCTDLVAQLHAVMDDEVTRLQLIQKGVQAAADLDWRLVAERIEQVYEKVIARDAAVLAAT